MVVPVDAVGWLSLETGWGADSLPAARPLYWRMSYREASVIEIREILRAAVAEGWGLGGRPGYPDAFRTKDLIASPGGGA